ncbi:MAG: hypothetical protein K2X87_25175 [Gemmataceae bacterium]|nr:hypothetical protein [Gemmataceae bacterium]
MVVRALITVWFFVTSVLGPALCCCAYGTPRAFASGGFKSTALSTPDRLPLATGCPHCTEKTGSKSVPEPTGDNQREPVKHCPGKCPCQGGSGVSAAPDTATELRSLVHAGWALQLASFDRDAVPVPHLTHPTVGERHRTAPPPPFGVELLHRLHVLIC